MSATIKSQIDLDVDPNYTVEPPAGEGFLADRVGSWNPPFSQPSNIDPLPVVNGAVESANANIIMQGAAGVLSAAVVIEFTQPIPFMQFQLVLSEQGRAIENVLDDPDLLSEAYGCVIGMDIDGVNIDPPNPAAFISHIAKFSGVDVDFQSSNRLETYGAQIPLEFTFDQTTKILDISSNGTPWAQADYSGADPLPFTNFQVAMFFVSPFGQLTGIKVSPVQEV